MFKCCQYSDISRPTSGASAEARVESCRYAGLSPNSEGLQKLTYNFWLRWSFAEFLRFTEIMQLTISGAQVFQKPTQVVDKVNFSYL